VSYDHNSRETANRLVWRLGGLFQFASEQLLLRAIGFCPCYKSLGNGPAQLVAGNKIHWIVNARPNSRIAAFFPNRTNEIRVCWEQVCKHFRPGG
jgi:hypothetical protein